MVWVRLDDSFPDHRKIAELGDYAPVCGWLFICGLAYCNRQLTDGLIPKQHVVRLSSFRRLSIETGGVPGMFSQGEDIDADTLALLLESVGLWEDRDTHWYIHDYPDYQPTKADVEAERAAKQASGRAGGIASAKAKAEARAQAAASAVPQAKFNPVPVPVPVPNTRTEGSNEPSYAEETSAKRITAGFREEMALEFPDLDEPFEYEKATNHVAYRKAIDKRRYYRNWLTNARKYHTPLEMVPAVDKFRESRLTKQIAAAKERMG